MGADAMGECVRRVLVVGGSPEAASGEVIRTAAVEADRVVAVDRGLDAALSAGLSCYLFCGDADSVSAAGAELVRAAEERSQRGFSAAHESTSRCGRASAASFEVERYDPHKDFTDLSLALRAVRERWGAPELVCTCLTGGKPDHALAALGCLASYPGDVRLEGDGFTCRILHAGRSWQLDACAGARFSFVPLADGTVVSEEGMRWNLDRKTTTLLSDLGISNVIECDPARITCHVGILAAWCFARES